MFVLTAPATSVTVGDLNGDGRPDLVLTKKGSGSVTVLLGNGKGGFAAGVDYPAGKQPANVVVADLNGDGRLDVVVTDDATGAIDVLAGKGDGTLGAPVSYAAVANPVALAVGNFAGKGKFDLAVAGAKGLAILLNDGTGHFSSAASIPLSVQPGSLAAADLKGAGHDDLVLANLDGTVTAMLGDGSGNFHAQSPVRAASGPLSAVVSGDFNGDGRRDLAVTAAASNAVTILLGRGDGSFEAGSSYPVGNKPASLIAADLRGSGIADLVTVNQAANTFSVLVGNGDGTFRPSTDFTAGNSPLALAAGDFNSDGKADLAIVNYADATISVPLGRGDGSFVAARAYRADLERKAIASGDLNGDGRPDLVVTNYCGGDASCAGNGSATVFLAKLDGTYKAASTIALGNGPVAVSLADLDGSKKLSLLALNRNDQTLIVMPGNGDGTFGATQIYSLPASPRALYVADFNGDGKTDLAIVSDCGQSTCSQPGSLDIFLGRGDGSLAPSASYTVGFSPVSIAAGDLRGTGRLDLVVANACGNDSTCAAHGTGTVLAGDGAGKFTQMGEIDLGVAPSSIALGKLTRSGLDLAVAQRGSNQIAVMHSDGAGGFGAPVTYAVGKAPSALAIADFNGDGVQDIAVSNFQSSTVSVLYGTGSGALNGAIDYPVGSGPDSLVAVTPIKGGASTLVTADGNAGATPMGNGITSLGGTDPGTATSTTALVVTGTGSSTVNQSVTMTATVTGNSAPTGTVTFTSNGADINDCNGTPGAVNLTGSTATTSTAVCVTQSLLAGSDSLVASYSGDPTYEASDSSGTTVTQAVAKAASAIAVASSSPNNTSSVGQSVTYTATVTPSNAAVGLGGTVSFTDNAAALACSSPINDDAAGTFTCSTTYLTAGTHAIVATYASDANYLNKAGNLAPSQTVGAASTTTTLASSGTPSALNASVTFTATLNLPSGATATPTGTMAFTDNGTAITGCGTKALALVASSYQATCATSTLTQGNHAIIATYSTGDTNYSSSSGTLVQVVSTGSSTVTLTAAPQPSTVNQGVLFTATIAPVPSGTSVPLSGTVTLTDGSNGPVAGCTIAFNTTTGKATCTTSSLAKGSHTITATYSGDTNFPPTGTAQTTQVVNAGTATIALSSSGSPSATNASVTFTAAVTANPAGSTALSGTVSFTDTPSGGSATPIANCSAAGLTAGAATCTTSSLALGSHTITAAYNNDSNFTFQAGGNTTTQVVSAAGITMTLGSSANPASVNQTPSVIYTASITAPSGGTALSGTVTFTDAGATIAGCNAVHPSAAGVANCSEPGLTASGSPHSIAAAYTGDTNFGTANATLTPAQTVNKAATSLALVSSQPGSAVNASVTFTATLSFPAGTVPLTGSVAFTDSATAAAIPGCSAQAVAASTGIASCSTSTLALGSHTITATYTDTANNFSTAANTVTQTVGTASVVMTLSAPSTSGTVNQAVPLAFDANITAPSGTTALSGTVAFTDNGAAIPTCSAVSASANGTGSGGSTLWLAVCSDPGITAATSPHTIAATYSHDTNFGTASATLATKVTVAAATTSLALTAAPASSSFHQSVVFTATLSYPAGGVALSGNVAFTDSVTSAAIPGCSSITPSSNGVATCTYSDLANGTHTITATFANDSNFTTSNKSVTQTVGAAATSVNIASSVNPSVVNASVTFTATVSSSQQGSTPFTGTMSFLDNGTAVTNCTGLAVTAGAAMCTTSSLLVGTNTITASYANDPSFAGSSNTLVQTVNQSNSYTLALGAAPSAATIEAGQSVTFTASITPTYTGAIALNGMMVFTDVNSPPVGAPTSITLCTVAAGGASFAASVATCPYILPDGSNSIVATYTGDTKFTASSSPVSQTVADFAVTVAPVPQNSLGIEMTQGFTIATDPYPPQPVTLTPSSISGYTGTLTFTCAATPAAAGAPKCTLAASTVSVVTTGVQSSDSITLDATGATPGTYPFTLTAKDANGLTHTYSFPVTVRSLSTPLSVVSGATTGNTATISFVLPAGVSLPLVNSTTSNTGSCATVVGPEITTNLTPLGLSIGCSFNPATVPASTSQQIATVTVTVSTGTTIAMAQPENRSGLLVAGVVGLPIFGLLGLLGGRKSTRTIFLRLLAIVALCAAGWQVMGCGGSFQGSNNTGGGATPPGVYNILVQGTGSDKNTYQAVIQLNVKL